MFSAIILAFFKIFLPVAITGYLMIGLLLDSGKVPAFTNKKELDEKLKAYRKEGKKTKRKEENVAIKKWLQFGGGFYGTAAAYCYALIEVREIFAFIFKIIDPANWKWVNLVDVVVGFVINTIMNFVKAIIWFDTIEIGPSQYIWLAFIAAYFGYRLGAKIANDHYAQKTGHVQLWRWIEENRKANRKEKAEGTS